MTRKHFVAAVEIVRALNIPGCSVSHAAAQTVADAFIELAVRFNPLFNRERFLQACGLVD